MGVEQFSGLLQVAAIVAAACIIIINASSDLFAVEERRLQNAGPDERAFAPKYQGMLARKVRRRIRRHSELIYGAYAILALALILSLAATQLLHGCDWLEAKFARSPLVLDYLPYLRGALRVGAFDANNLAVWFVILASIFILVLAKIARDTTRVRQEHMETKVRTGQAAAGDLRG